MAKIFSDGIPLLRKFLYQTDRLLYFENSTLMSRLLNEDITSGFFASAWFISLFTVGLKEDKNEGLLAIWDTFLLYGWKAIFRAGVFMFSKLKTESTEDIIGKLGNALIFKNETSGDEYLNEFKKIKVTNEMLELLTDVYISVIKAFGN